tara:strand:+ start:454 stop:1059 length:606 start_codon:yes stop_codon:yes gene_type:complete
LKVLVADDLDLVRETIAAFLLAEGISFVTTAADLPQTLKAMQDEAFDLALLDHEMPSMNGLSGLGEAIGLKLCPHIALMSGSTSKELAEAALAAGAVGFVPKKMASRAMVAAVRLMARGETFAPIGLLQSDAVPGAMLSLLTRREVSVLGGICEGKSNKEIARDLALQEVTVKLHVKTLSRKLDARNRTHAAMIARNAGLV